jgi:hypothetical protein
LPAGTLDEKTRIFLPGTGKAKWSSSAGGLPAPVNGKKGGHAKQLIPVDEGNFEDF